MPNLVLDEQGRPVPQHLNADGSAYEALKGDNNAGNVNVISIPSPIEVIVTNELEAEITTLPDVTITSIPAIEISILPELPTGSNKIGEVDIDIMPAVEISSIPAIEISSLPELPAGTNTIGAVELAESLPSGTNVIGKVEITGTVILTHTTEIVTDVSALVLEANANRRYLLLQNDSDTIIYISFDTGGEGEAVAGSGIRLAADGGSFEMKEGLIDVREIYAVAEGIGEEAPALNLMITEGE